MVVLSYILVSAVLIRLVLYFSVLSRRCNSTSPDQWTRKGSDEDPKGLEDPTKRRRTTAACLLGQTEQRGENDLCLLTHVWTALIFTERWIQHPNYSIYDIGRRIHKREIKSNSVLSKSKSEK